MYSLNGIELDNEENDWILRGSSSPLFEHGKRALSLRLPGVHGVSKIPSTFDPVIVRLDVETPKDKLEELLSLASSASTLTLTSDSSRVAEVEFLAAPLAGIGAADEVVEVRIMLRVPGAFWRDASATTTTAASLSAASVDVPVFAGLSAPVQDAIVRVKGACTGLRVTDDASLAYFDYSGELTSSQYLRFESASGRAWVTSSDVWTGGTEVSGDIDLDGPLGVFEITPLTVDPADREAVLVVTTATRSSAQIQVRGRGAYLV